MVVVIRLRIPRCRSDSALVCSHSSHHRLLHCTGPHHLYNSSFHFVIHSRSWHSFRNMQSNGYCYTEPYFDTESEPFRQSLPSNWTENCKADKKKSLIVIMNRPGHPKDAKVRRKTIKQRTKEMIS